MTYRLLLWFDMLEEEGKSTKIRGLFSRMPLLSKGLSSDSGYGSGINYGKGSWFTNGGGQGNGIGNSSKGNGFGDGLFNNYPEIIVIKI